MSAPYTLKHPLKSTFNQGQPNEREEVGTAHPT